MILRMGSRGTEVRQLQEALDEKGFDPKGIDGIFGKDTRAAVIAFQEANNLAIDGVAGPNTLTALYNGGIPAVPPTQGFRISWDSDPARQPWTDFLLTQVRTHWGSLEQAADITRFRHNWMQLNATQKELIWAELICGMCYHESAWKPTSRMVESGMGTDPVTGMQVASEGLLQLSYQDERNYSQLPEVRFNWAVDKTYAVNDPRKSIFDVNTNLRAGVAILAHQVEQRKRIVLQKNYYWAVLAEPGFGKYTKVPEIAYMVEKLSV